MALGLFGRAYTKSATVAKAINGFAACGIWPFNQNIFNNSDFAPAQLTDEEVVVADVHAEADHVPNSSFTSSEQRVITELRPEAQFMHTTPQFLDTNFGPQDKQSIGWDLIEEVDYEIESEIEKNTQVVNLGLVTGSKLIFDKVFDLDLATGFKSVTSPVSVSEVGAKQVVEPVTGSTLPTCLAPSLVTDSEPVTQPRLTTCLEPPSVTDLEHITQSGLPTCLAPPSVTDSEPVTQSRLTTTCLAPSLVTDSEPVTQSGLTTCLEPSSVTD